MDSQPEKPRVNKWLVALTVMVPTFIEVMDISVTNVSLPHIQGSLSAGLDEVTWVLTSYLVSNAIVIPMTGWLASVFGRKRYMLFSITLFTASSIACGSAPTLEFLIVARIFQGLGGGGLQPLSQAILLETFPVAEHGLAMAVFGMGVVMAPILGPVVGGWITDNWTWRWIFYVNIPVGILAVALVFLFIYDPPYIRRAKVYIDRWGIILLSLGLGSLQVVLDKGQREDWFNSHFIIVLSVVAAAALVLFVIVELRAENPVVQLRVFKDRSFTAGNIIMFTGFFCMFASIVLLPLYLQKLMDYTALWAGLVLGPGGIASLMIMPVAGILMKRGVSARSLLGVGLALMAYSIWLMSGFNLQAGFLSIAWPRVVLGFAVGLFFVPLAAATYVSIPKEEIGNASGIFNLLRNLGGSCGVAFSTTVLVQRAQFHQNFLVENITPYRPQFQITYQQIMNWLSTHHAELADPATALSLIYREVLRQASMLAFNDTFFVLSIMTACLVPLTIIFRKAASQDVPGGMH